MQKLYYSIREICDSIGEEQHILRYWEKEFDCLKPKKNRGGNRIYSEKDLAIIKIIKQLLRNDKLSLKGAKEQLAKILEKDDLAKVADNFQFVPQEPVVMSENKTAENGSVKMKREEFIEIYDTLKTMLEYLKAN